MNGSLYRLMLPSVFFIRRKRKIYLVKWEYMSRSKRRLKELWIARRKQKIPHIPITIVK